MQKYKDRSLNIEERIDDLLSKMTNEEKVGQMLQVSYNTLSKEDYEKYKNLGIGSFLHVLYKKTRRKDTSRHTADIRH